MLKTKSQKTENQNIQSDTSEMNKDMPDSYAIQKRLFFKIARREEQKVLHGISWKEIRMLPTKFLVEPNKTLQFHF